MYETEICVHLNLYYCVFKYVKHIQFISTITKILSPFPLVSILYDWQICITLGLLVFYVCVIQIDIIKVRLL